MDALDRLSEFVLRSSDHPGPEDYSHHRTSDLAQKFAVTEFDVQQQLEEMYHANEIDLVCYDGQQPRAFDKWTSGKAFWVATTDGGHKRIKTLLAGKRRLHQLEERVTPTFALIDSEPKMPPERAIRFLDACIEKGRQLLIGPFSGVTVQYEHWLAKEAQQWTNFSDRTLNGIFSNDHWQSQFGAKLSSVEHRPTFEAVTDAIRSGMATLEEARLHLSMSMAHVRDATQKNNASDTPDPKKVFVIHGRNEASRRAMFSFLRALGLEPIEWTQAIALTGAGTPYIGEILDRVFEQAQAIIALLTGDDLVRLGTQYQQQSDPAYEKEFTPQARPNVLFEAGLALGRKPDRTILVSLGSTRPFSDIAGRHVVTLGNDVSRRQALISRLRTAGCAVAIDHHTDWTREGDFDSAIQPPDVPHNAIGEPQRSQLVHHEQELRNRDRKPTGQPMGGYVRLPDRDIVLVREEQNGKLTVWLRNDTLQPIEECSLTLHLLQEYAPKHNDFRRNPYAPYELLRPHTIPSGATSSEAAALAYPGDTGKRVLRISNSKDEKTTGGIWRALLIVADSHRRREEELFFEWQPSQDPHYCPDPCQTSSKPAHLRVDFKR
ncbi:MAG: TIR domain-containing protein [Bryobacteraceae bacterium]